MTDRSILPDHARIDAALNSRDVKHDPSEIHGALWGMLCVEAGVDYTSWVTRMRRDLFGGNVDAELPDMLLEALFAASVCQLADDELSFSLLLPEDDVPLGGRTRCLGHWCEGFLLGLTWAAEPWNPRLSAEAREFIRDLTEISRVDSDIDAADEQDEQAFAEIVEYVRMGVLLVNQELRV